MSYSELTDLERQMLAYLEGKLPVPAIAVPAPRPPRIEPLLEPIVIVPPGASRATKLQALRDAAPGWLDTITAHVFATRPELAESGHRLIVERWASEAIRDAVSRLGIVPTCVRPLAERAVESIVRRLVHQAFQRHAARA